MTNPNTEAMQAAAGASLKELGLDVPRERNPGHESGRLPLINHTTGGATDQGILSDKEVAETIAAAHQHTKLQSGLRMAGESQAVAEVLAQAGELSRTHAQKLRDAIEPLQRRLHQEAAITEAMANDEPANPDETQTRITQGFRARLAQIREGQAMLDELLKLPVTPATLGERLSHVQRLLAGEG